MLVVYSSSSEEEEGGSSVNTRCLEDGEKSYPEKKRLKIEQLSTKTKLPVPHCVLNMFPEELDPQTEDSSLHGGRIRSFKHEQGNWATYVYLPYDPELEFTDILQELVSVAKRHGIDLTPQEEFHLSLSQTVVLRHHWIQPFTQNLKAGLAHCRRFMCTAERLKVYCNAEKTRTFIGVEVSAGTNQLLDIIKVVDKTMTDFRLDTFYKNPSFHISLAWCIGDSTAQLKSFLKELQSIMDKQEDGPYTLSLNCVELRCRTGNKVFRFPLSSEN
ncbi:U6 snRNA phosphodiesterase 1 [Boleophthalmus pectinirostris]|uniref:U6 snRNA phosphodiesterase 1 n=1 Tax=Boleophthalmus pectinirostris TaxID=150288 RepID=UPI000A1C7593|nr:U6 snRNA phosphodiesterase 1 [Boleophthalmus pectinirostris]